MIRSSTTRKRIVVTARDIATYDVMSIFNCPLANAFKRALKPECEVVVGGHISNIDINGHENVVILNEKTANRGYQSLLGNPKTAKPFHIYAEIPVAYLR